MAIVVDGSTLVLTVMSSDPNKMKVMKEAQMVEGATLDLNVTSSNLANVKAFFFP